MQGQSFVLCLPLVLENLSSGVQSFRFSLKCQVTSSFNRPPLFCLEAEIMKTKYHYFVDVISFDSYKCLLCSLYR